MKKVEFYQSVKNRKEHYPLTLEELRTYVSTAEQLKKNTEGFRKWKSEKPDEYQDRQSDIKKQIFPCVQWSGTFNNTGKADDIKELSGLIVLDFDHVQDVSKKIVDLQNDPYGYFVFTSPSDEGIKVVVKHDLTDVSKWFFLFKQLSKYFSEAHHLETDLSGSDISRMCFIPFITNAKFNETSKVFPYDINQEEEEIETNDYEAFILTQEIIDECKVLGHIIKDKGLRICEEYEDWLKLGFSLALLGEDGREIFHQISKTSKKYNKHQTDDKFDNCINTVDIDRTSINTFKYRARFAFLRYSIYNEYNFLIN